MENPNHPPFDDWWKRIEESVARGGGSIGAHTYTDLRAIAGALLKGGKAGQTLQPTALVHEAYLRIARLEPVSARDRKQFLALAAKAMRSVLVDHARRKNAARRGAGRRSDLAETLEGVPAVDSIAPGELVDLDAALSEFESIDPERARVVELLYFGGLSTAEAAELLETTPRSIQRAWAAARAWLHRRLANRGGES